MSKQHLDLRFSMHLGAAGFIAKLPTLELQINKLRGCNFCYRVVDDKGRIYTERHEREKTFTGGYVLKNFRHPFLYSVILFERINDHNLKKIMKHRKYLYAMAWIPEGRSAM
jgi:hypothetical protein